jgi:hypothetical protein
MRGVFAGAGAVSQNPYDSARLAARVRGYDRIALRSVKGDLWSGCLRGGSRRFSSSAC